ncbi:hypothetical protein CPC08DRAFT_458692 [Agrocybe pediades]|nr:hypothetical protein CPC08DRAFT_458692 [Agrocybe pediades]
MHAPPRLQPDAPFWCHRRLVSGFIIDSLLTDGQCPYSESTLTRHLLPSLYTSPRVPLSLEYDPRLARIGGRQAREGGFSSASRSTMNCVIIRPFHGEVHVDLLGLLHPPVRWALFSSLQHLRPSELRIQWTALIHHTPPLARSAHTPLCPPPHQLAQAEPNHPLSSHKA